MICACSPRRQCICIFACITARAMVLRAGAYQESRTRLTWLLGAGMVSGAGVWATHFVAMLAYDISLPMSFDLGLTILSVVIAMTICGGRICAVVQPGRGRGRRHGGRKRRADHALYRHGGAASCRPRRSGIRSSSPPRC